MICQSTLKEIKSGYFSTQAIRDLFGGITPNSILPFSRSDFFTEGPQKSKGISISGVQQKLSLKLLSSGEFEIVSIGGEFIIKPSPESYPHAAENEHCSMVLSRTFGIETAQAGLVQFTDGEFVYITRRYDRDGDKKHHQEDLLQGFNLPSKDKYSKSYEEALELAYRMSGGKLSVVRDLFSRILFSYVIGNDDMHLKNMSLIRNYESKSHLYDSLTPNYDQLMTHAFENHSTLGVLAIDLLKQEIDGDFSDAYNKYGFYTASDFYILAEETGLRKTVVDKLFKKLFSLEDTFIEIVNRSFMPQDMKERSIALISDRIKAVKIGAGVV